MEKSESFIFFTKAVIRITQNLMGSKVDQDPPPPFFHEDPTSGTCICVILLTSDI